VSCKRRCTPAFGYRLALLVELVILCLWIPPVYVITKGIAAAPGAPVPVTTIVALLFFLLNMQVTTTPSISKPGFGAKLLPVRLGSFGF